MAGPRRRRGIRIAFWRYPAGGLVLAMLLAPVTRWIDHTWAPTVLSYEPEGAASILGSLVTAMLTFIVFVVSSLLLVVQLASAQLTPRIIALAFQSRHTRRSIALFAFVFSYAMAIGGRVGSVVPQLSVAIAVVTSLAAIAVFFRFANQLAADLRPVSILTTVGMRACRIVESVYPLELGATTPPGLAPPETIQADRIVVHDGNSGSLLGFDADRLVRIATTARIVIEMVPQVGDYVARGDVVFRLTAGARPVDDGALRACIEVGPERTLEQDPRFGFRIIVDIANKALSPAINDPTTAVLAIDQIHRMLQLVGRRRLDEGTVRDGEGRIRLIYGTPDWEDFVCLGVSEIRHYGASSIQVTRRLFALLAHLIQILPAERRPALEREKRLLQQSVLRAFPDPEDRIRAQVCDSQGVGGSEPVGEPSRLEVAPPGS